MADITKVLRSNVAGARPSFPRRQKGELYVNEADKAIGIIDVNGNPLDIGGIQKSEADGLYIHQNPTTPTTNVIETDVATVGLKIQTSEVGDANIPLLIQSKNNADRLLLVDSGMELSGKNQYGQMSLLSKDAPYANAFTARTNKPALALYHEVPESTRATDIFYVGNFAGDNHFVRVGKIFQLAGWNSIGNFVLNSNSGSWAHLLKSFSPTLETLRITAPSGQTNNVLHVNRETKSWQLRLNVNFTFRGRNDFGEFDVMDGGNVHSFRSLRPGNISLFLGGAAGQTSACFYVQPATNRSSERFVVGNRANTELQTPWGNAYFGWSGTNTHRLVGKSASSRTLMLEAPSGNTVDSFRIQDSSRYFAVFAGAILYGETPYGNYQFGAGNAGGQYNEFLRLVTSLGSGGKVLKLHTTNNGFNGRFIEATGNQLANDYWRVYWDFSQVIENPYGQSRFNVGNQSDLSAFISHTGAKRTLYVRGGPSQQTDIFRVALQNNTGYHVSVWKDGVLYGQNQNGRFDLNSGFNTYSFVTHAGGNRRSLYVRGGPGQDNDLLRAERQDNQYYHFSVGHDAKVYGENQYAWFRLNYYHSSYLPQFHFYGKTQGRPVMDIQGTTNTGTLLRIQGNGGWLVEGRHLNVTRFIFNQNGELYVNSGGNNIKIAIAAGAGGGNAEFYTTLYRPGESHRIHTASGYVTTNGATTNPVTVWFGVTFASLPIVVITPFYQGNDARMQTFYVTENSTSFCRIRRKFYTDQGLWGNSGESFYWMAMGRVN